MTIAMVGTGPIGGTCVNVGCVPSKYLLAASHSVFKPAHPRMPGLHESQVKYDFSEIMGGLRLYVNHARDSKYVKVIENYSNVKLFTGLGSFLDKKTVVIKGLDAKEGGKVSGSNILIATGSHPSIPNIKGLSNTGFITSDTIWEMNELPESVA